MMKCLRGYGIGNKNTERIVQIGEDPRYRLCISVLTGINVLYVLNKFSNIIGLQI